MSEAEIHNYIAKHKLDELFQKLLKDVLVNKPDNPAHHLLTLLNDPSFVPQNGSGKKGLKIIIAGAPASGKGTQCEIIKQTFGVFHLSTGDALREQVSQKTELGLEAEKFMSGGLLVPDNLIIDIVLNKLATCEDQGWLLDGFPRSSEQAKILIEKGVTPDIFILLEVPDEVLVERVTGRRTDPETRKIYHMTFNPPPEEVVSRLVQRSDDTEEKVKVRLEQYHTNLEAIMSAFSHICVKINGNQAMDEVSKEVLAALNKIHQQ